jgi:F-type H+-transporting ATPase subunit alpha
MSLERQVAIIYAAVGGYLDELPADSVKQFEKEFLDFLDSEFPDVPHEIRRSKDLSENTEVKLKKALVEFVERFKKTLRSAAPAR